MAPILPDSQVLYRNHSHQNFHLKNPFVTRDEVLHLKSAFSSVLIFWIIQLTLLIKKYYLIKTSNLIKTLKSTSSLQLFEKCL